MQEWTFAKRLYKHFLWDKSRDGRRSSLISKPSVSVAQRGRITCRDTQKLSWGTPRAPDQARARPRPPAARAA